MKLQYYVDATILFIAEIKRTMNFDGSSIRDLSMKMQKLIMYLNMNINVTFTFLEVCCLKTLK